MNQTQTGLWIECTLPTAASRKDGRAQLYNKVDINRDCT